MILILLKLLFSTINKSYPTVAAHKSSLSFRAHRMVLYLWGGPNNAWDGYWEHIDSLEGDHIRNDIYDWCIWYLQWLTGVQNIDKERRL